MNKKIIVMVSRFVYNGLLEQGMEKQLDHYKKWLKEQFLLGNVKQKQRHRFIRKINEEEYKELIVKVKIIESTSKIVLKITLDNQKT